MTAFLSSVVSPGFSRIARLDAGKMHAFPARRSLISSERHQRPDCCERRERERYLKRATGTIILQEVAGLWIGIF